MENKERDLKALKYARDIVRSGRSVDDAVKIAARAFGVDKEKLARWLSE